MLKHKNTEYRSQKPEIDLLMILRNLILIVCLIFLIPSIAFSQVAGKLTRVEGRVDILRAGAAAAVPVKVSEEVSIGDILRTKSDGLAEITFIDNSVMTVGPKSRLGIEEYLYKGEENKRVASLKLHRGKSSFTVPKPVYAAEGSKFEMKTRTAVAGVRGTEGLLFSGAVERVYVKVGRVQFSNPLGSVTVTAGRVGEVIHGRAPVERPYSEKEFKQQEEGVKTTKTADKKAEGDKTAGKGEAAAGETVPPPPPPPAAGKLTIPPPPQPLLTVPDTKLPTVEDVTGKTAKPKDTNVNINVKFP